MPTEAKRETVAELRSELEQSSTLIVSEYRGLTVKEIGEIRRALRKQDVRYRVVKNRLLKIAAADGVGEALDPLLTGPTAIAFGTDEARTAKAVIDALRPYRVVRITGGVLGDRRIDADDVQRLVDVDHAVIDHDADRLAARFALLTTVGLLDAPLRDVAGLVAALADKRSAAVA